MKPTNNGYNITGKQRKMPKGVPFVKGDSRCWRKGRPPSFDQLRALAQAIAQEEIIGNGRTMTRVEAMLRIWSASKEPTLQKAFMEIAFGKVPDKIEGELLTEKTLTLYYNHERPGHGTGLWT